MKKQHIAALAGVAILLLIAVIVFVGYQQGWIARPALTVEVTVTNPDGEPLEGAAVSGLGQPQGETGADGKLAFEFSKGVGEEVLVSATFARPGLEFEPWEERFVVRKWDRGDPESLRYALEAVLEPKAVSAVLEVVSGEDLVEGAAIEIGGKKAGESDAEGQFTVDLGTEFSRMVDLSVRAKGHQRWRQKAILKGGETFTVSLAKIGVIYGKALAAYESLGRVLPVEEAEVSIKGKAVGMTDKSGNVRFPIPRRRTTMEVRKAGYLPEPAETELRGARSRRVVIPLHPAEAPTYRLVVLPPKNGTPGDNGVQAALPEIEDKLSDYIFSYGCFRRVDPELFLNAAKSAKRSEEQIVDEGWAGTSFAEMADAVVYSEAARAESLVLSVSVISVTGKRLGAFAETEKFSKVRKLTENAAGKVLEIFPFEGHVLSRDGKRLATTLSSAGDRDVKKGAGVEIYRWSGSVPVKLTSLGRGKVRKSNREGSEIELASGGLEVAAGDKIVLLPRAKEAAFSGALELTLMAGSEGTEVPFGDVNVYRDGTWVGTTSAEGRLRIPVASGRKHSFLFVRGGVKPYAQELEVGKGTQNQKILMPNTMTKLRLDSQPSGARVIVDGRDMGSTPLEAHVLMGFRRIEIDGGKGWRVYDKVMELTSLEENYTGSRRIVLEKDVLAEAHELLEAGDVDKAISVLRKVDTKHPDYSAAHNMLGGIYLDEKEDADNAVKEFESVLARPENRELVNKRFTVTFLNLGRAYYLQGTAAAYEKAIRNLTIARNNKRFFPKERYDMAIHDTLYFLALASHKLYSARPGDRLLSQTSRRWKDYFDFFPKALQDDESVLKAREGAEHFHEEIRRKAGE